MLLVDLLRSHESALEWHTQTSSNADFCLSQNPWAGISKRASGALLVPWFNISPVTSWRACSTSTLLQTILSISASKSCSSLWRWIINPPRWHKLNWTPHAQITGVSVIIILILQAIIITKITNSNNNNNNYWMRLSIIWRIMKIEVSVIRRSRRPRQITPSEISIVLQMIRKANLIIVLLFIKNNSSFKNKLKKLNHLKAKTCLPPSMLSSS